MQVLLIHADTAFAANLGDALERSTATVDYAATGRLGMQMVAARTFDAIVLAAELPGTDGLQVCRRLREMGVLTPVMMMGLHAGVEHTIAALEAGADNYLAQTAVFMEVHARLSVLCRRQTGVLKIGDLQLDPVTGAVHRQGERLHPTQTELKLLRILMETSPRVVSRSELETRVWGQNSALISESNVRKQIHSLRAVIDKPFDQTLIRTHRGAVGLWVVAEGVETVEQQAALAEMNCDSIQGFLISRPIGAHEIPDVAFRYSHAGLALNQFMTSDAA